MNINRRQPAAVLILALLFMIAITASTITISIIISESTHQTRALNDFVKASILADSGIERGLAVVKAGRTSQTIGDTITAISQNSGGLLVNATLPDINKITRARLRPGESIAFDTQLFNASPTEADMIINIAATLNDDVSSVHGRGALDVSWVGLGTNGEPFFSGRRFLTSSEIDGGTVNSIDLIDSTIIRDMNGNITTVPITETRGFRIRITAIETVSDISGLTRSQQIDVSTLHNIIVTTNSAQGFSSEVTINSTGKIGGSQSEKTAVVPWELPVSPLFNYVLFTEGKITPE